MVSAALGRSFGLRCINVLQSDSARRCNLILPSHRRASTRKASECPRIEMSARNSPAAVAPSACRPGARRPASAPGSSAPFAGAAVIAPTSVEPLRTSSMRAFHSMLALEVRIRSGVCAGTGTDTDAAALPRASLCHPSSVARRSERSGPDRRSRCRLYAVSRSAPAMLLPARRASRTGRLPSDWAGPAACRRRAGGDA